MVQCCTPLWGTGGGLEYSQESSEISSWSANTCPKWGVLVHRPFSPWEGFWYCRCSMSNKSCCQSDGAVLYTSVGDWRWFGIFSGVFRNFQLECKHMSKMGCFGPPPIFPLGGVLVLQVLHEQQELLPI